ncbi:MAG: Fis family transcriptional regulator [Ponticaulis sp.]|nr:Fis family transcriptional regulator [Ponticaulis sp.]
MEKTQKADTLPHAEKVLTSIRSGSDAARSMIVASWARSAKLHGLAPDAASRGERWGATELRDRRDRLSRMIHVSQPTLHNLRDTISFSGCGVFLCDAEGIVLEALTSAGDKADFDAVNLSPGGDWSEKMEGTNGIGTCIAEGRSVSIHQDQHFRSDNISMSCLGAPIYNSDGSLLAVLDISVWRADVEGPLAKLISQAVTDAAGQIEADHFCDQHAGARILRGEGDNRRSPVLLAVNSDDLVVGATRAARKHFGLPAREAFSPKPATDLLGGDGAGPKGFERAEQSAMKRAIARADGNMSEAARQLGVSRATFYRRATKLGLIQSDKS